MLDFAITIICTCEYQNGTTILAKVNATRQTINPLPSYRFAQESNSVTNYILGRPFALVI